VIGNFENFRGNLEAYTTIVTAIVSNYHIRPILGLITMPIVINVEPVFGNGFLLLLLFLAKPK